MPLGSGIVVVGKVFSMSNASISLDTYPSPAPGVVGRTVQDEAVLVLTDRAKVEVLNSVGARIWELSDGHHSLRAIAAKLCAEYQVDAADAEADVLHFVGLLVDRGALRLSIRPAGMPE